MHVKHSAAARTWLFLASSSRSNTDAASFQLSSNARARNATISSEVRILFWSVSEKTLSTMLRMPFRALALAAASSPTPLQRRDVHTCGTSGAVRDQ
eukprot:6717865-Prymnesium_polylepis.2